MSGKKGEMDRGLHTFVLLSIDLSLKEGMRRTQLAIFAQLRRRLALPSRFRVLDTPAALLAWLSRLCGRRRGGLLLARLILWDCGG